MTVVLNEAALAVLLNSPDGPVGIDLTRRAAQVTAIAIQNVAAHTRTGELRNSLRFVVGEGPGGLVATIGSNLARARYLELGTEAHGISGNPNLVSTANNPDPLIKKPQQHVNHPGQPPRPFLVPALLEGFR